MSIYAFEIVSVPVADPQRAKAFYRDILGFELMHESPMGPSMTWIQLKAPGCDTSISLVTWFDKMPPGSLQGVMINTDDLEGDVGGLRDRGLAMSPIAEAPWGKYSMFNDPDGNGWILRQPPA
jgi:catechol 2,3-dioxygenase-like lactoylglutathione lyase family enzyme